MNDIQLINSESDEEIIKEVLIETEPELLKYIRSISIHSEKIIVNDITGDKCWGLISSYFDQNNNLEYSTIEVVSSKFRRNKDKDFKRTLKHEIGHVKRILMSVEDEYSEKFSRNYSRGKGFTEFDKILSKIENIFY